MSTSERKTVSFEQGEITALDAVLKSDVALDLLRRRVARLRSHIPAVDTYPPVEALDVTSLSDTIRALVRVGLDTLDRDYTACRYEQAAPALSAVFADPGVQMFLEESAEAGTKATDDALVSGLGAATAR